MVKRGDIYYADLGSTVGHEQRGTRPVLILQNDIGNKYSPTVVIACMTAKTKSHIPTHLEIKGCGLSKDSTILLEQIRTIDKKRLERKVGQASEEIMEKVGEIIDLSLGVKKERESVNELIKIENGEVKLDSRMIAEHFEKNHADVLRDIRDEIEKLENANLGAESIFALGHYIDKNRQARPCYEITEEGALQLAARYDAVARRKLIIKIKELKNQNFNALNELSPLLQLLIGVELKQKAHDKALNEVTERLDDITDIVSLNSSNWRHESRNLISKIAIANGGDFQQANSEIYKQLEKRMGVDLDTRLANKWKRMVSEGVSKSARTKITKVDIIAEDKKLVEGYLAIVKEMAIAHGVNRDC